MRAWICARSACLVSAVLLLGFASVEAAAQQEPAGTATAQPAEVRELLELLARPQVRGWLEQQATVGPAPAEPAATPDAATAEGQPAAPGTAESAVLASETYFDSRLMALRSHLRGLTAALPILPAEVSAAAGRLWAEMRGLGLFGTLLLLATFALLGYGAEWVFWRYTKGVRAAITARRVETIGDRLRTMGVRLAFALSWVATFALGSFGAFLLLEFPPRLRAVLLGFLLVLLAIRVALVIARFLLSPGAEKFRIVPMPTPVAFFWTTRIAVFTGVFVTGWVVAALVLPALGMQEEARRLVAYTLGLLPLAVALEIIWNRPRHLGDSTDRRIAAPIAVSLLFIIGWLAWVVGSMPLFWLLVVLFFTPLVIGLSKRSILHLLRPVTSDDGEAMVRPSAWSVLIERIARAAILIGAVAVLAWAWGIDFNAMAASDTAGTRLIRGLLNAVVIVLIADLLWQVVRTAIEQRIEEATQNPGEAGTEEARKRSRLRTLLPIVSNILLILVAVMGLLMALSSLGIEVGPLIAGAGVVGVAIGFGAQTLVKDVISGIFFLLDDAFRVGEYIQAGSYKGTVESFSLRSIKLRHHRGPLYTVPFGELGAVQNMSRDWVIDILKVSVTYDTDLEKVKRIIKQIGKELLANEEFAPNIIQTLKMQGVDQFGDYAIMIRMKMMTKPGEQFVIRRYAYLLIKKAFKENGIEFAFPTVTVAGGEAKDVSPAVLQHALDMNKPVPEGAA